MPTEYSNFSAPDDTSGVAVRQRGTGAGGTGPAGATWDPAQQKWIPQANMNASYVDTSGFSNATTDRSGRLQGDPLAATNGKVASFGNGTVGATWGGYGGTMVNGVYHPELNGANADMARLSGLGAAAANRQAYQTDYSQANGDAARGADAWMQQGGAANLARNTAMNGEARSQALGQRMLQNGVYAQQAAAQSTRGGSLAQAAAMHQQQAGQGAYMQQGNMALQAQRADDMAAGRAQYMGDMTKMREQDAMVEALHNKQAINQAGNEIDQRDLNQQGQMGYEAMGQNVSKAAGSAMLGGSEIDAGIDAAAAARSVASAAKAQQTTGAAVGASGSFVAGISNLANTAPNAGPQQPISGAGGGYNPDGSDPWKTGSDERMKQNVRGLAAAAMARKGGY